MAVTFLALSLFFSGSLPALSQGPCDRVYTEARDARDAGRPAALARLARKARACFERHDLAKASEERLMRLYSWEGFGLVQTDRLGRALDSYDAFFKRFAARRDSLWFRHMHHQRGLVHYDQGNLLKAVRDFEQALAYAAGTSPRRRATLSEYTGAVYQRMRAFDAAQRHYRRADRLLKSADRSDPEVRAVHADVLLARADLLLEAPALTDASTDADWRTAIRRSQQALALLDDAPSQDALHARVLLADAHGSLGETAVAERHLDDAARLAERMGSGHWAFFIAYKRGRLHLKAGATARAQAAFQEALQQAGQARHADYRRRLLEDLGLLHERKGTPARAEQYYRRAVAVVEDYRAALGTTDWAAQAFAEWQAPYRGLVRALLAQDRPHAAFRALERSRARHLRDLRTQAHMLGTLPARQRQRFDSLTTALTEARTRLGSDTLPPPTRARLERREIRLMTARDTLVPPTVPARDSLSLTALRQALAPRGRVLVSYFIDDPGASTGRASQSTAFVLTEDQLATVPLPAGASADSLSALTQAVSPLLAGEAAAGLEAVHFSTRALKTLYDRLIAPLRSHLPKSAPLTIIPDGPLFALPFPALLTEETPPYRYRDASFLVRQHPIAIETAAALVLPEKRQPAPAAVDVAAFGKTHFADVRASEVFRTSSFGDAPLPPLPSVADEIAAVRQLFGSTRVATGADATEPALANAMREAKVLHVASHAFASEFSPLHSAIALTPSAASRAADSAATDGLLHLHELGPQRPAARLVLLSGCNTARGRLRTGEGMAGLQHAFRSTGVESTLSTLWPAEDDATVQLTKRFHRHLRDGHPKDVALQRAQLAYLEEASAGKRSPFFWAAPVLYGRPVPLTLAGRPFLARPRNAALGIGFLLALAAGVLLYRHLRRRPTP